MKYLTTGQLAEMAGVSRQWIHQLATNKRIPVDGEVKEKDKENKDKATTYLFKEKTAIRIAEQIKAQRNLPTRRKRKYE